MGGEAVVRRATRTDLSAVTALWIALTEFHAAEEPLFALRAGARDEASRLLEAQLRDPDTALFVSEEDGRLIGLCIVRVDQAPPIHSETRRAEITDLFVAGGRRRRGLGSALVREAHDWARGRGVLRVEVRVASRNPEGQAFWRSQGFGDFMDVLHRRL